MALKIERYTGEQHDYSTDRPDAGGAFGGVREADS
jgi:hypothetical protein